MNQTQQVIETMKRLSGIATFDKLNSEWTYSVTHEDNGPYFYHR